MSAEQKRRSELDATYGPSALATPANFVTVLRLLIAPVLFAMIFDQVATWPNVILWTILAAIEEAVPAEVLSASLYARFRSRQEHTFAEKMLSAMRKQFGGHVEPPKR